MPGPRYPTHLDRRVMPLPTNWPGSNCNLDVIVECVNPIRLTRDSWLRTADEAGAGIVEVEVVCSDESEHRRRVETRTSDVEGLVLPTWAEPWSRKHVVVDSARTTASNAAQLIMSKITSVRSESS